MRFASCRASSWTSDYAQGTQHAAAVQGIVHLCRDRFPGDIIVSFLGRQRERAYSRPNTGETCLPLRHPNPKSALPKSCPPKTYPYPYPLTLTQS